MTQSGEIEIDLLRRSGRFLQGRISWAWLSEAARLPGKSLHVALVLRLLTGMCRSTEVELRTKFLRESGVQRHAAYRALKRLEEAELVSVKRHVGKWPVVRIRER